MSRSALAVLISVAGLLPAAAGDPFTGNLTEPQIRAIKLATIARFAGTKNTCPRVHFVEVASFKAMADTGIAADVIRSTEFGNVVAEAWRNREAAREPGRLLRRGLAISGADQHRSLADA